MKKNKWQELTTSQKIGYIRDYYTVHIIAAVLAIAAVGWALNHYVFNPPPRTFVNIAFYGQFVSEEMRDFIAEDLTNSLVEEGTNYAIFVDNYFTTGNMEFDMATTQRMVAMVAAREIDILIIAPGEADSYIDAGFARYIHDFEEFAYFGNLAERFGADFGGWTLIVMSNSDRDNNVRAFLDYTLFFYDYAD